MESKKVYILIIYYNRLYYNIKVIKISRKVKEYTDPKDKPWTTVAVRPVIGEELSKMAKSQGKYVGTIIFEALKAKYPDKFTDKMIEA